MEENKENKEHKIYKEGDNLSICKRWTKMLIEKLKWRSNLFD